jgi:hypothetical protein
MKFERLATRVLYSTIALILAAACPTGVMAQDGHSHASNQNNDSNGQAGELIRVVRDATAKYQDVHVAEADGYALQFGCVTGPDSGAMGLHYVNGSIVASGVLDPRHPQIVIYEPTPDGHLKLTGADFLVFASTWDASHSGPPQLMGQLFHYFESPNRFGLPAFYTLHVWAWKENPNGAFVNWHPNVSCQSFSSQ